jgi:hypothetical protein
MSQNHQKQFRKRKRPPTMKILYVEDELTSNLDRIIELFGQTVLSPKQVKELKEFNNDPYGADIQQIRNIMNRSGVLTVETEFAPALKLIEENIEEYAIFIVDRQLATDTDAYKIEDIAAIVPEYTSKEFDKYFTREGDYLYLRLLNKKKPEKSKMFYFLTAYTDMTQCKNDLLPYKEAGWFTENQVVEKDRPEQLQVLCDIINKHEYLAMRRKYRPFFDKVEALDNSKETLEELCDFFSAHEKSKQKHYLSSLGATRRLLEKLVKQLCKKHDIRYEGNCRKALIRLGPGIENKDVISDSGKSAAITVYTLCSDYGSHTPKQTCNGVFLDDVFNTVLYACRTFLHDL